jgi:phosphoglycerate dehydrogenase-like enzyme
MPDAPRIVTVSRPVLWPIFDDMEARLATAGYEVKSYRTLDAFRAQADALAEADILLAAGDTVCSRELMLTAPRLRAVISPFTGTEGFDEQAATDLGILIANGQTPENSESMAEATILLTLAALYDLHGSEAVLRGTIPRPSHSRAFMLRGKTVGMIGYGNIARAVTKRLAGWGVRLTAWSRTPDASTSVEWLDLDTLLRDSDVVCVLLSLNAGTRGLLDATKLRLMKPDAVLVNTARGGIIDEPALYEVLKAKKIAGAALDVFVEEPTPKDNPLLKLDNFIAAPHVAGVTKEAVSRMAVVAVENILSVIDGKPNRDNVINPEVLN